MNSLEEVLDYYNLNLNDFIKIIRNQMARKDDILTELSRT
jgi:hypothetical protein